MWGGPSRAKTGHKSYYHSITSSARNSTTAGIVRPSALAVLRFKTNSNLVGVSIGVTAGFAPSKIFAAMVP